MNNELFSVQEDLRSQFEDLINQLIGTHILPQDVSYPDMEQEVIDTYMNLLEKDGQVPDFADIIEIIEDQNFETISELAALDMVCGRSCPEYSHEEMVPFYLSPPADGDSEENSLYEAFFQAWYEEYYIEAINNMPLLVEDILSERKLCYAVTNRENQPSDLMVDIPDADFEIHVNDAQTILFVDWHVASIAKDGLVDYFFTEKHIEQLLDIRIYPARKEKM